MAETFANRTQNAKDYLERYRQSAYEDLNEAAQEKLSDFRFEEQEKAEREHGEVEAGEAEIGAPVVMRGVYNNAKGIYGNVKKLHSKISDILNKKQGTGEEAEQEDLPRPTEGGVDGEINADLNTDLVRVFRAPQQLTMPDTIQTRDDYIGGKNSYQIGDEGEIPGRGPAGDFSRNIGSGEEDGLAPATETGADAGGGAVSDIPSVASNLSDDAGNLIRGAGKVAARAGEEVGGDIAGKIAAGVGEAALDAIPGIGEAALAIQGLVSIGEGIAHLFHHPDKAPAVPPPTPLAVPHNITSKFSTALPENGIHEDMAGASSAAF
tara:strand:- start:299 stop:1264 length:966 start_codon:yes stop_codon:yes gene_type:complete